MAARRSAMPAEDKRTARLLLTQTLVPIRREKDQTNKLKLLQNLK